MPNTINCWQNCRSKTKPLRRKRVRKLLCLGKITELDYECKSLSLIAPELNYVKQQNSEVINENSVLKNNIGKLEGEYNLLAT